ncbi:MAG: bifunctional oligoribonuclease/PAP phosphatase NrnA [Peptoniphilaceae bacterium]|nr:bifunctional oligoribonuclease/PAP phosphatase NrnA [Peptoniphilaceae bacterium]MDY3986592.1 bifunctional oligoribonuclease/PAP phosphatase NrnA [Peptoniphilaceae bacterium]
MDQAVETISKAKTIAISGHVNPDGDCLGAVTGLGKALQYAGKQVDLFASEKPRHYSYLPGIENISTSIPDKDYDLFILVDLGDRPRMGDAVQAFNRSKTSICFDHHMTNERICDQNLVFKDACSTCELLGIFLNYWDPSLIRSDVATSLYAGITTDSNRFLYDTARARAMRVASDLIDAGADVNLIYLHEFQSADRNMLLFQGDILRSTEMLADGKIALARISLKKIHEYHLPMSEAEGVVDLLRSMDGVEIAVILKEKEANLQKISFRSKEYFNVAELAKKFDGGGHWKASGGSIHDSFDAAYDQLRSVLKDIVWTT